MKITQKDFREFSFAMQNRLKLMKIILDTNIILYAAKQKTDLVSQVRDKFRPADILVPNLVIRELEKLAGKAKKGSDKRAAKLALQIIKFSELKIVKLEEGHTDDRILELAKKEKAVVGTNDSQLKRRLKKEGIQFFALKQGKLI